MKKENKLRILTVCLVILSLVLMINVSYADSGWDSSYDSGGSWSSGGSSGSSWDGGHSYGSHSSGGGSYSGGSGGYGGFFVLVNLILFYILLFYIYSKTPERMPTKKKFVCPEYEYKEISEEELAKILPEYNLTSLKKELFNKFVDIQKAWMNFDYDKLKELCTDELFNSYKSQLEVLKLKNGQNIMKNFKSNVARIIDIKKDKKIISVSYYLATSFYDYVIDTKTKKVTRGHDKSLMYNTYIMTFVINKDSVNKNKKCPSCGAPIKGVTSSKCEYCGSKIVFDAKKFVLSKKTRI